MTGRFILDRDEPAFLGALCPVRTCDGRIFDFEVESIEVLGSTKEVKGRLIGIRGANDGQTWLKDPDQLGVSQVWQ